MEALVRSSHTGGGASGPWGPTGCLLCGELTPWDRGMRLEEDSGAVRVAWSHGWCAQWMAHSVASRVTL